MDVEKVVREYIDKTVHLSLATVADNKPWVCEVHFAYDSELNIYFRSLSSRRHSQDIASNGHVAGNIIDRYELGDPVVGVYFEGIAEKLEPGDAQNLAAQCIEDRLKTGDKIIEEAADPKGHQFYKITVTNWSIFGRFDQPNGTKYTLPWKTTGSV